MASSKRVMSGTELRDDKRALMQRVGALEREFSSFRDHYRELSEFVEPRRGRFFVEDRNRGDKRWKSIINNRGTLSLRGATAGMMAGVMSPSRPWFDWDMMDKDLLRDPEVALWLNLLKRIVYSVFASGNLYNMAPSLIKELLLFGTGCMTHVDDFDDVARFYTHTVGSYMVAQDNKYRVNTLARKFQMTAFQMAQKFGKENLSISAQNNLNNNNAQGWHTIWHVIELNEFRNPKEEVFSSEFKRYRSVYWEANDPKDGEKFLERKGFADFPAYVPRWELTGEDIYATNCPGMSTLGDIKQLQVQEREKAKAIAKNVTPPLQGPASMRNQPIPNLPGGVSINTSSNSKIEPLYAVDPRIQEMAVDIDNTERRIDSGFYRDLFLTITEQRGIQPKNELQLSQMNEERLLQLGPALEQVNGEWLARLVSRTVRQVLAAELMPPAPGKLEGQEVDIQFVSALAVAQRSVATSAIERVHGFVAGLAESGWPTAVDKLNADESIDEYTTLTGAPPQILVSTEKAQEARAAREQQAQQAQQMEQAAAAANVAKMASDAKLGDDNVLSRATGGQEG